MLVVLQIVVCDEALLEQWYEKWAFLRQQEMAAMLPNLAAGRSGSLVFSVLLRHNGSCSFPVK